MVGLFLGSAFAISATAGDVDYTTEPLDQVKTKVETKKAFLADVREEREWKQGHLQYAVLLPLSKLSKWDSKGISAEDRAALAKMLPQGSVVYCHCAAGGRALPGAEALKKLGYDARPLRDGYRDLVEAGFKRGSSK
jgi:rhodanese-related sulfurtransferase